MTYRQKGPQLEFLSLIPLAALCSMRWLKISDAHAIYETNFLKERFSMPDYRQIQKFKKSELFSGQTFEFCYFCG